MMYWSALTCCVRGWICQKFRWWQFWMRTKKGFLRSERSLDPDHWTCCPRNVKGKTILYADRITDSMRKAMDETERRRNKQIRV